MQSRGIKSAELKVDFDEGFLSRKVSKQKEKMLRCLTKRRSFFVEGSRHVWSNTNAILKLNKSISQSQNILLMKQIDYYLIILVHLHTYTVYPPIILSLHLQGLT